MSLTLEQVEHVAHLARMRLEPEELEKMRQQLSDILDHFQLLQQVDVSNVPPTAQVTDLANIFRDDEPRPSLTREQALSNAPAQQDGMFRVRDVFGE